MFKRKMSKSDKILDPRVYNEFPKRNLKALQRKFSNVDKDTVEMVYDMFFMGAAGALATINDPIMFTMVMANFEEFAQNCEQLVSAQDAK